VSSAYYDLNPLEDLLEFLVDTKRIAGIPSENIARHAIAFGEESLSMSERELFDKEIQPLLELDCSGCLARIDADDLHEAYLHEVCAGSLHCRRCRL
jgi:hypothetical protein